MTTVTPAPLSDVPAPVLLIGEDRITDASGGTFQHVYAATGQPTYEVPLAGPAEIDRAVRAARSALPAWRAMTADRRRDLLTAVSRLVSDRAEELTRLNIIDNGTPIMIAAAQNSMAVDLYAYNAGWADKVGGQLIETWPVPALDYTREDPYAWSA